MSPRNCLDCGWARSVSGGLGCGLVCPPWLAPEDVCLDVGIWRADLSGDAAVVTAEQAAIGMDCPGWKRRAAP